jgi:putative transposase
VAQANRDEAVLPERVQEALGQLVGAALDLKRRMMIVALGITIPLGLWEGSTDNATVATALLSDLVQRGLDPELGMLFVLDGSKHCARRCARCSARCPSRDACGTRSAPSCRISPSRDRPPIKPRMRRARGETDDPRGLEQLTRLADELDHTQPSAAGSLREGCRRR